MLPVGACSRVTSRSPRANSRTVSFFQEVSVLISDIRQALTLLVLCPFRECVLSCIQLFDKGLQSLHCVLLPACAFSRVSSWSPKSNLPWAVLLESACSGVTSCSPGADPPYTLFFQPVRVLAHIQLFYFLILFHSLLL